MKQHVEGMGGVKKWEGSRGTFKERKRTRGGLAERSISV